MCPHCRMVPLMLMKRDWALENDIAKHKWMSSEQQSANDEWLFEDADHFCVPSLLFSLPTATCRGWCFPLRRVCLCRHVIGCKLEQQTAKWVQLRCYGAFVAGNTAKAHTCSAALCLCGTSLDKDSVEIVILVPLCSSCQEILHTAGMDGCFFCKGSIQALMFGFSPNIKTLSLSTVCTCPKPVALQILAPPLRWKAKQ